MKKTDYQKVFDLAINILKDEKQMILLTNDLDQKLKALEGTFLDDGIDEIKTFVKNLTDKLVVAQSEFSTIASELHAFGLNLKAGKGN